MACNCGRRRAVIQQPPVSTGSIDQQAQALVASTQMNETTVSNSNNNNNNKTDPATGTVSNTHS